MKILTIIFAGCFFFFSRGIVAGQAISTGTDTLLIHISGQHYPKLNLVFGLEDNRYHVSKGIMIEDSTWQFVYPRNIYEEHLYVKLSVKEHSRNREILLRTVFDNEYNMSERFGIPEGGGKISLLLYKSIDGSFYRKDGYTLDLFHVENPDFEIFSTLRCALFQDKNSYNRYLSELKKLIKQHPDSHSLMVWFWEYDRIFKTKQDMLMLYNAFSEDARNSYFGKKVKKIIDIKNTIILN